MTLERIDQLLRAIRMQNVRGEQYAAAEEEILRLGPSAAQYLAPLLKDADPVVRHRAEDILAKLTRQG